ncbi:MAG: exodeoxyribonuclease VII large subunit, partial [Pseudomonadota bacterium]
TMPEEGMEVIAEGKMTASGFSSKFALNATRVAVAGEGALMAMLERRKKKLAAEGLFDDARKKRLPYLPDFIGVITSPQGAVIRDILHRLRDRFPRKVLVWPVAVQGKECAPQVARAVRGFNAFTPGGALPRPDLLIVARGGGSIEDLWGFNEEEVARAVADSDIPVISAVGHETDTTLIDFVADRRAPTPTAAAELAVPVRRDLLAWTEAQQARLVRAAGQAVDRRRDRLRDLARVLPRPEALLNDPRLRLDRAEERLSDAPRILLDTKRATFVPLAAAMRKSALVERLRNEAERLATRAGRLAPGVFRVAERQGDRLTGLSARLRPGPLKDRVAAMQRDFDRVAGRLDQAEARCLTDGKRRLDAADRLLRTLGYEATLARGYAVVRAGDRIVTDATSAGNAKAMEIEFRDGRVAVTPVKGA